MKYQKIIKSKFISRPNRFVAVVEDPYEKGAEVRVHVKNTGRCKELLVPGATVYLEDFQGRMGQRKMRYSLVAVDKAGLLINMDSQAPNKVVGEALSSGALQLPGIGRCSLVKAEKTFGNSRFDFYIEGASKGYAEVKGVTLENDGHARFPDAPTERGLKHIDELIKAKEAGYEAFAIFVIQMKGMRVFSPNYDTQPEFGEALKKAKASGVEILAIDCIVREDELVLDKTVPVDLDMI